MVKEAKAYPVVFSITHCHQALICYVDAKFTIRMIETAHHGSLEDEIEELDDEISEEDITRITDISKLNINQRTILECNINFETFKQYSFPNLIEKQIFYQIIKNRNLSLEKLHEELKILEKAMNIEIDYQLLNSLLNKYEEANLITRSVI